MTLATVDVLQLHQQLTSFRSLLVSVTMLRYVFLCFLAVASAYRTFHGDQVLRIHPTQEHQLTTLQQLQDQYELDFWKPIQSSKVPVDIHVPAKHLQQVKVALTRFRVPFEIFIEDLQVLVENERSPRASAKDLSTFDYEVYHTFEEIQQWVDEMETAYPDLVTASVVGTSFEGRQFKAISISTNANNPQFVLNCGIHAREWVTPATCLYSAKWLVEGYKNNDATITDLLNSVTFVFIPSSNPDGYAYTWSNDRMWRKTRSTGNGVCTGVDPNRNWDANWSGPGASSSSCSDTYYGPSMFSEPCTLAQKNFVEGLSDVRMYVDVHSYSQLWMFPYGYKTALAADHNNLNQIAQDSVNAIFNVHGMVYEAGAIASTIYVASGSTSDYFYDAGIPCTFATELRDTGRYGFVLPERLITPTAEESFAAFKVMAQAIIDEKC